MSAHDLTDELLVSTLGHVLDVEEPLPAGADLVRDAAFALARPDATLAELLFDSATEDGALTGVRASDEDSRSLSFAAGATSVELEVLGDGTVVGRIEPPSVTVTLEIEPGEPQELAVDGLGRFLVTSDASQLRLVVRGGDTDVVTPWIFR